MTRDDDPETREGDLMTQPAQPSARGPLGLDARLWEVLACPCPAHADLTPDEAACTLTCAACGSVFRVEDGIPEMLLADA